MSKNETEFNNDLVNNAIRLAHDLRAPAMLLRNLLKQKSMSAGNGTSPILIEKSVEQLLALSDSYLAQIRNNSQGKRNLPAPKTIEHLSFSEIRRTLKDSITCIANLNESHVNVSFYNYLGMQSTIITNPINLICAERATLRSVFENLIKNAFEACTDKDNPQVSISLYLEKDDLVIEVQDNGQGMSRKKIMEILSPSSSQVQSTKTMGHGVGLKGVISQLKSWNAVLSVSSNLKKGTCLSIALPIVKQLDVQNLN